MGALAESDPITSGRTYVCRVAEVKSAPGVDDDDRAEIDRRIAVHSSRVVAQWLSEHGHPISAGTVLNHQRHLCQCYRPQ